MSQPNIDLNKLRDEIATEKSRVRGVPQRLGEATGRFAAPKDEFLHGLVKSLQTGEPTPSSQLLKEVDTIAESKAGGKVKARIPVGNKPTLEESQEFYQPRPAQPKTLHNIGESADREEQMYQDFGKLKTQTLAEALEDGIARSTGGRQQQPLRYGNQPMAINEQALVENVRGAVNGYLAESLMPILEESTRSVIIEMYAVERIKSVLQENRAMIKELVIEVIRDIQSKQKAK